MGEDRWDKLKKACAKVTSVGLFPGDVVVVFPWDYSPRSEGSLRMVVSVSRGHTQVVIKFLELGLDGRIIIETFLPHKYWFILPPETE